MLKYLVVALCIAAASAGVTPYGVVEGHTQCSTPGRGRLIELRVTDCTRVPCVLVPDVEHVLEVDFEAASSASSLFLKLTAFIFGIEIPILDTELENSAIAPGSSYTLQYGIVPNSQLSGQSFNLRGEVQVSGSRANEVCVNVPCRIS